MEPRNGGKEERERERRLVVDRMKKKAEQVRKVKNITEKVELLSETRIKFIESLNQELLRLRGFVMELKDPNSVKMTNVLNSIDNLNFMCEEEIDKESKKDV